jgi:Uma2 family endonuclease
MAAAPFIVSSDEMSFEEYLVAYDGVHAEWVDGRVSVAEIEGAQHSRIRRFIASILQAWAEEHDLGEVYLTPFAVRLGDAVAREPDVFFVSRVHADRVTATHLDGAADLIVEVAGRSSRRRARGESWCDYEAAGVSEYWLVDPERKKVEAWRLGENGWYEAVPLGTPPVLRSDVLAGLAVPAEWLWQEPLPRLKEAQKAWGLS